MSSKISWKTISQKYVYESKWMKLRHDEVIRPDGNPGEYDVLEKLDFVVLVCVIDEKFVMVEQDRYTVGTRSLEFSMGGMEAGERPEEAAKREFEEETGYRVLKVKDLGRVWPACGYSQQGYYVFLVEEVSKGRRNREGTEADMGIKFLSESDLKEAISGGLIKDAATITAYCLYQLSR